jgi:hypothetical protein
MMCGPRRIREGRAVRRGSDRKCWEDAFAWVTSGQFAVLRSLCLHVPLIVSVRPMRLESRNCDLSSTLLQYFRCRNFHSGL